MKATKVIAIIIVVFWLLFGFALLPSTPVQAQEETGIAPQSWGWEYTLENGEKVKVGDSKTAELKPVLELNRWGGECSIKLVLPTAETSTVTKEDTKLTFSQSNIDVAFYPLQPRTVIAKDKDGNDVEFEQCTEGGFEFEVFLKEKPKTNQIVLNIETQGLKFYYQSPLTQEEIDEGCIRPDNVVGSYAVYHDTKGNIHSSQANAEKYKVGKAFHIYRPKITDAVGKWVWGELKLDEQAGTLTTIIPQDFLDKAVYPVSTGTSNFGYESPGGTAIHISNTIRGDYFTCPEVGIGQSITVYMKSQTGSNAKAKCALYKQSDDSFVAGSTEVTNITATTWYTFTLSSPSLENIAYWLVSWGYNDGSNYPYMYSDTNSGGAYDGETYNGWPNPWSPTAYSPGRIFSIYCTYEAGGGVTAPTVTTSAASDIEATTATGNGNITDTGGENCDYRGVEWDTDSGAPYSYNATDSGDFGTGAFTKGMTSLSEGTTIYYRAMAHNSEGWGYGSEQSFLTKPAAPTNVSASDGASTENVTITWTKSNGATDYQVYRDGVALGWAGDVATYTDTGADAPTITAGTASASDGDYVDYVALGLSGQSASNGTSHTYKVRAKNGTGESADSSTDTGYRGVGSLTYQWQRSATDSDADYSNIDGAITADYNDTGAPENGDGRYYKCVENASGASENTSSANRGYRAVLSVPTVTTSSATDMGSSTATLNGSITATGGQNADTRGFEWGYPSGNYTDNWTEGGSFGTGAFSHGVSGLSNDTTYYYRAMAHNDAGWGYGSEIEFTTGLSAPSGFALIQLSDMEFNARWDAIEGVTGYLLMISTVNYPDSPDGAYTVVYSGNATSVNIVGYDLEAGVYYASLWSHTNPYSSDYATATIGASTLADVLDDLGGIVQGLIMLLPLIIFSALAFWRFHPVLFMFCAGIALITAFYMADIINGGTTSNLSLTVSLALIGYSLVCIAFAYRMLFKGVEGE